MRWDGRAALRGQPATPRGETLVRSARTELVRVALADDSALFRRGVAVLLHHKGWEVVAEADHGEALLTALNNAPDKAPDVVVLDIRMPPTYTDEGIVTAERLRVTHPGVAVLALSTYLESAYAVRLLSTGSRGVGYLLKDRVDDIDTLDGALQRLVRGESVVDPDVVSRLVAHHRTAGLLERLSERERDVLRLMAEGRSNGGISQQLYLSPKTVETHVAGVFTKLGLPQAADDNRRVLAVLAWLRATGWALKD